MIDGAVKGSIREFQTICIHRAVTLTCEFDPPIRKKHGHLQTKHGSARPLDAGEQHVFAAPPRHVWREVGQVDRAAAQLGAQNVELDEREAAS